MKSKPELHIQEPRGPGHPLGARVRRAMEFLVAVFSEAGRGQWVPARDVTERARRQRIKSIDLGRARRRMPQIEIKLDRGMDGTIRGSYWRWSGRR